MNIADKTRIENPLKTAGFVSKLFFWWTAPIFKKGFKNEINEQNLCETHDDDKSAALGNKLEEYWREQLNSSKNSKRKPSLIIALAKSFKVQFVQIAVLQLFCDLILRTSQPLLLANMLWYFDQEGGVDRHQVFFYAAGVVLSVAVITGVKNHMLMLTSTVAARLRVACCSLVYRKLLRLGQTSLGEAGPGQLANLVSGDVSRFDLACYYMHSLWVAPLSAAIIAYLAWREAGLSGLLGLAATLGAVTPVQAFLCHLSAKYRKSASLKTDERIRIMGEIISAIRIIKMYTWEEAYIKNVLDIRKWEINKLRKMSYLRGVYMALNICSYRTALFVTAVSAVMFGQVLSAVKVFVLASYFATLCVSMSAPFVRALVELKDVVTSLERIQTFLLREEFSVSREGKASGSLSQNFSVILSNATARWNCSSGDYSLREVYTRVRSGKLVAVVGSVGSGKSSLLQAVMGELTLTSGWVAVNGRLSYAPQEPWLFPATVRRNIVFDSAFDEARYERVVSACALAADLKQLPAGDMTQVGEKGCSLSGGQRARISLARAVYKDADIYLLDDPLSAVDPHVCQHLFEDCINTFLQGKTRILVTHQLHYLKDVDRIIFMKKGCVEMEGTYDDIVRDNVDCAALMGIDESTVADADEDEDTDGESVEVQPEASRRLRRLSRISVKSRLSVASSGASPEDLAISPEMLEATVSTRSAWTACVKYFYAGGNSLLLTLMALSFIVTQILGSFFDYWTYLWTHTEATRREHSRLEIYQYITAQNNVTASNINIVPTYYDYLTTEDFMFCYAGLIISFYVVCIVRSVFFFNICMKSSTNLHGQLLHAVMNTTTRFFDTNTSGRIINRFSKDVTAVDEVLCKTFLDAAQLLLTVLGSYILVMIIDPKFILPVVVVITFIVITKKFYMKTSTQLRRLEGACKSPMFTHINATFQGLSVIRAYGAENVLQEEFDKHQDLHTAASQLHTAVNAAYSLVLDVFALLFIAVATIWFFVFQGSDASKVGLTISQLLGLVPITVVGVCQASEVETSMTSVDRILEYTDIEQEKSPATPETGDATSNCWPEKGGIEFRNIYLKYTEGSPQYALKRFSLEILPGEKVGVVGRTGAGKSSLVAALFRTASLEGLVLIDGVDTACVELRRLRASLSIIPQDPVLVSGTLRSNLDPAATLPDYRLWAALQDVDLKTVFPGCNSLDAEVEEGGRNFSVGQKQVICLARAILKKNKILVLDEATANVDHRTDALIQATIREKFAECTVLTVAHRLNTIMDSDKVLVMENGWKLEFDHPYVLLQNRHGAFYRMVEQTGPAMAERLWRIAQQSYASLNKED